MINEREIQTNDRGPLPNSTAASYVTSAIIEAERENRRRAMTFGICAVVSALVVAFVLLQILSSAGNDQPQSIATDEAAVSTSDDSATVDLVPSSAPDAVTVVGIDPSDEAEQRQEPSSVEGPESPIGDEPMTLRGMGVLSAGMTVDAAETALGGTIIEPTIDAKCVQTTIAGDTNSPILMIVGSGDFGTRTLARIDMVEGNATRSGIGIGSTSIDVITTYEERIETSVPQTGIADQLLTYVPVDSADAAYRIVMETVDDEVVGVRNGQLPWVGWNNGCQR